MMPKRFLYCLLIPVLWACKESPQTTALYTPSDDSWEQVLYNGDLSDTVTVQIVSEPPSLHPTNARTSYRDQILGLVHQRLHILDVVTPGGIFPELALGAPVPINNGDSYSITIHPQATWPDGAPITADDVIFTIKAMACPLTDNRAQKAYFEYLTDVRAVEGDPKTVIFDFREYYMNNQNISVLSFILDPRKYDPDGVMAAYSIPDFLGEQAEALSAKADIQAWAAFYNDASLGRDLDWLNTGSGPYEVIEWTPEQRIVLQRRENYWGKDLPGYVHRAYPPKIIFTMISEDAALEQQLKEQKVDVASLSIQSHKNLLGSETVKANYRLERPSKASVALIAWNMQPESGNRPPIFNDVNVRRAVAYAIPLDSMIAQHFALPQQRSVSPVAPNNPDHNNTLTAIPHDPAKARTLLAEAGWADSDGDGTLDKLIAGQKINLSFEIYYAPNSQTVVDMMNRMETELAIVGIKMVQKQASLGEYLQQVSNHQFDAALLAMGASDLPYDFKQVYHSESWGGGSNLFGYQNPQVDIWIDQARIERDPAVRKDLVDKIQAQIYQDQPALFFFHPRSEMAIHKRFSGGMIHPVAPHVILNNLQVVRE